MFFSRHLSQHACCDDWFSNLFGFNEPSTAAELHKLLRLDDGCLVSSKNGARYVVGDFSTPKLAELRATLPSLIESAHAAADAGAPPALRLSNVIGDVSALHTDPANRHATFQVASQFNCLEFVHQNVTPEDGVTGYERDHTQGPACAIACGAATVFRNYFADVGPGDDDDDAHTGGGGAAVARWNGGGAAVTRGQRRDRQIENLADVEAMLDNARQRYWRVTGGYTLAGRDGLGRLAERLNALSDAERDALRGALRVGVQRECEVTATSWGRELTGTPEQRVTQVFGSACAVAYNHGSAPRHWAPFATLVLEASYEATLLAAAQQAAARGWRDGDGAARVYLTCLGGGVFGNEMGWIVGAIMRACARCRALPLDVRVVIFRGPVPRQLEEMQERIMQEVAGAREAAAEAPAAAPSLDETAPMRLDKAEAESKAAEAESKAAEAESKAAEAEPKAAAAIAAPDHLTCPELYEDGKFGRWAPVLAALAKGDARSTRVAEWAKPTSGWTLLHQAAYYGDAAVAAALLQIAPHAADAKGKDGKLPCDVATEFGHAALATELGLRRQQRASGGGL